MNHSTKFLALAAVSVILTGCDSVSFLYPLTEDARDLVTDVDLTGTYRAADGDRWVLERTGDGRYQLTWSSKQETMRLDASLVRVSNYLFLDVAAMDEGVSIRGHHFAKVRVDGDALELAWLDGGWLKKKLTGERALAFERPCVRGEKDCSYVVTASPAVLQSFLMRNAMDEDAFGKADRLTKRAE